LSLTCAIVQKGGFGVPDFGHAFSHGTHFQACGQFWLSSIQQGGWVGGKEEERKKEEWQ